MRHSGSYGALHETHREVDEQQNAPAATPERAAHRPNYDALRETQHELDEQQAGERVPDRPVQRSWTHRGGMVQQQHSALIWNKQNIEIKMAANDKTGTERGGEGTQPNQENDPELQQALAAVEDAKRREAAERARQQERDRGGPER